MALDIIRPGHRVEKPSLVQCLWSMWLWTKALPELDLFRPLLGGIAPPNALSSLLGGIRCCPCCQEVTKIWGGKCVTYGWHRQMCGCGCGCGGVMPLGNYKSGPKHWNWAEAWWVFGGGVIFEPLLMNSELVEVQHRLQLRFGSVPIAIIDHVCLLHNLLQFLCILKM